MSQYLFGNNAVTTLGSSLGSSATTLTVATGTGAEFPAPAAGQIVPLTLIASGSVTGVPNEIVYATNRTGDTFTIVRGQEGTTAQAWSAGATVANMATAEFYNEQATSGQIQTQAGNYAVDSGAANAGIIVLAPVPVNQAALVGVPIRVKKMANPNTGAYTLNVNGLGAGAGAVTLGGRAMEASQLVGSEIFEVMWNGANYELMSNPALIDNSGLALMALETIKANLTGGAAKPTDVTLADLATALGITNVQSNANGSWITVGNCVIQFGKKLFPSDSRVTVPFPETSWVPILFIPTVYPINFGGDQDNNSISSEVLIAASWAGTVTGQGGGHTMAVAWVAFGTTP